MKKSWSLGKLNFNVKLPTKKPKDKTRRKEVKRSISLSFGVKTKRNIVKCHSMVRMTGLEGRGSLVSAVSTESGIHMGSDQDTVQVNNQQLGGSEQLMRQTRKLTRIIKHVRRSQSYNVSDANKTNLKNRKAAIRPKSLVYGWDESRISVEELYLWQNQLKQLHIHTHKPQAVDHIAKTKNMTKVPKKESLREKARTLIRGFKTKRTPLKAKGSISSSCTEEDSTSSSLDRYSGGLSQHNVSNSDILRILKVFAGPGLHTNHNAEYRSVLATIDSTVYEIKKQSISKYGFTDTDTNNYSLVCSTGFYTDEKGHNISNIPEGFGSKSGSWRELQSDNLTDHTRPLDLTNLSEEEMDNTRLELRYNKTPCNNTTDLRLETIRQTTGLHHYPAESPFLILIQGTDRSLDHVIYPLLDGETVFVTLTSPSQTASSRNSVIVLHTPEVISAAVIRQGPKCYILRGSKREYLKCGQSFQVGSHYKFIYREAIDNAINPSSPEVGSPDTQRTLSTGTLTSLSPELQNMSTVSHQHAQPRFIFNMEHMEVLFDSILHYDMLLSKDQLACARITIMCLRHSFEYFSLDDVKTTAGYCKKKLEILAKCVQQRASEVLNDQNAHKRSASIFLKPMMKLLSSTLEILHFLKEAPVGLEEAVIVQIERLAVPMFEHVAYHAAKMVYELLPSILEPVATTSTEDEDPSPLPQPGELKEKRRWSVPNLSPIRKRKMTKSAADRPRSESLDTPGGNNVKNVTDSLSAEELPTLVNRDRNVRRNSCDLPASTNCKRSNAKQNLTNIGSGVKLLVQLLQKFHNLGNSCTLNSAMINQLFVSVFYFSNTTLFNTIMESPQLYFNWNKGIQLRVHLDYILRWTHQVQLSHTSSLYFKELNQLVDLLSLPKRDLLASTWAQLSKTFPNLTPVQLNHILSNYSIAQKPRIWQPSPPLVQSNNNGIRIELTSYPQLLIPTRGYKLVNFHEVPDTLRPILSKLTKTINTPTTPPSKQYTCVLNKSNSKSIGLKLKKSSKGCIVISDIVPNSPAHLAGTIHCNDKVLEINKTVVRGTSVATCKKIITECEGSVHLTLSSF